jgi:hypothetical protein
MSKLRENPENEGVPPYSKSQAYIMTLRANAGGTDGIVELAKLECKRNYSSHY